MSSRISLDPKILFIIFDIDAPMMTVLLLLPWVWQVLYEPCSVGMPRRSAGVARDVRLSQTGASRSVYGRLITGEQSARAQLGVVAEG
jgi:hypothetical protein